MAFDAETRRLYGDALACRAQRRSAARFSPSAPTGRQLLAAPPLWPAPCSATFGRPVRRHFEHVPARLHQVADPDPIPVEAAALAVEFASDPLDGQPQVDHGPVHPITAALGHDHVLASGLRQPEGFPEPSMRSSQSLAPGSKPATRSARTCRNGRSRRRPAPAWASRRRWRCTRSRTPRRSASSVQRPGSPRRSSTTGRTASWPPKSRDAQRRTARSRASKRRRWTKTPSSWRCRGADDVNGPAEGGGRVAVEEVPQRAAVTYEATAAGPGRETAARTTVSHVGGHARRRRTRPAGPGSAVRSYRPSGGRCARGRAHPAGRR